MAEVVEVEKAETQDCEFISEKMSEAQRKDLRKELEKHTCLWETCRPEYKNKPRRSRTLDELCQKIMHQSIPPAPRPPPRADPRN